MNPDQPWAYGLPLLRYLPEVYRDRGYWLYGHPSRAIPLRAGTEPVAMTDSSNLRAAGQLDDGPQTVEDLIRQGYVLPPRVAPETAVISDRKHSAWLGLDNLIGQVQQRRDLHQEALYAVDYSICDAINELYMHEAAQGHPATADQRRTLAGRLQDLETERRVLAMRAWKDESRLRQDLPEMVRSYLSAYRKLSLLDDETWGEPL